jgi:8-oxo-dGTP pyrophosphatase MutT (NUDIX family)
VSARSRANEEIVLDLKLDRAPVGPKDAATIVLVREGAGGVEVFCVERSKQSRFLGGAIVFPGGKLDESDAADHWEILATPAREPARPPALPFTSDAAHLRALAVAACRETLEEAAMLHVSGDAEADVTQEDLFALRARLEADPRALRDFLGARHLRLDLQALRPLARWVTPEAEARRYDARFFVAIAPRGQTGAHDERETMASFWATPADVLRRWAAGEVQVAPPTHCTLALLSGCASTAAVLDVAAASCLEPICPRLVRQGESLALALPGDPEHEIAEARAPGPSRYVLRGERWLAEDAPR